MKLKVLRGSCFVAGAVLFLWISAEYFMMAFVASRAMQGAGFFLWLLGYLRAVFTSPMGIGGVLLFAAGFLLRIPE